MDRLYDRRRCIFVTGGRGVTRSHPIDPEQGHAAINCHDYLAGEPLFETGSAVDHPKQRQPGVSLAKPFGREPSIPLREGLTTAIALSGALPDLIAV